MSISRKVIRLERLLSKRYIVTSFLYLRIPSFETRNFCTSRSVKNTRHYYLYERNDASYFTWTFVGTLATTTLCTLNSAHIRIPGNTCFIYRPKH